MFLLILFLNIELWLLKIYYESGDELIKLRLKIKKFILLNIIFYKSNYKKKKI